MAESDFTTVFSEGGMSKDGRVYGVRGVRTDRGGFISIETGKGKLTLSPGLAGIIGPLLVQASETVTGKKLSVAVEP